LKVLKYLEKHHVNVRKKAIKHDEKVCGKEKKRKEKII